MNRDVLGGYSIAGEDMESMQRYGIPVMEVLDATLRLAGSDDAYGDLAAFHIQTAFMSALLAERMYLWINPTDKIFMEESYLDIHLGSNPQPDTPAFVEAVLAAVLNGMGASDSLVTPQLVRRILDAIYYFREYPSETQVPFCLTQVPRAIFRFDSELSDEGFVLHAHAGLSAALLRYRERRQPESHEPLPGQLFFEEVERHMRQNAVSISISYDPELMPRIRVQHEEHPHGLAIKFIFRSGQTLQALNATEWFALYLLAAKLSTESASHRSAQVLSASALWQSGAVADMIFPWIRPLQNENGQLLDEAFAQQCNPALRGFIQRALEAGPLEDGEAN